MIKTIKINENQSVEINSSAGWLFVYREVFGYDILPDIMPVIESTLTLAIEVLQNVEIKSEGEIDVSEIVTGITGDVLSNLFINLTGLETTTLLKIVWSMAKNANDNIAPVREWFNQFDVFAFDDVMPQVISGIVKSSVSAKNAKRLLQILKTLTAGLTLTRSSLQDSTEG